MSIVGLDRKAKGPAEETAGELGTSMNISEELSRIRRMVRTQFDRRGSAGERLIRETILIRDGFYCGHRFERDDMKAEWLLRTNELTFYLDDEALAVSIMESGGQAA